MGQSTYNRIILIVVTSCRRRRSGVHSHPGACRRRVVQDAAAGQWNASAPWRHCQTGQYLAWGHSPSPLYACDAHWKCSKLHIDLYSKYSNWYSAILEWKLCFIHRTPTTYMLHHHSTPRFNPVNKCIPAVINVGVHPLIVIEEAFNVEETWFVYVLHNIRTANILHMRTHIE